MMQYRASLFYFILFANYCLLRQPPITDLADSSINQSTLAALYMTSSTIDLCKPPSVEPYSMFPCRGTFYLAERMCHFRNGPRLVERLIFCVETDWTMGTWARRALGRPANMLCLWLSVCIAEHEG